MRACKKCGVPKTGRCGPCETVIARAWKAANREKLNAYSRNWNAANKSKVLASAKQFRIRHAERLKATADADRDRLNARNRAWYAANKEKAAASFRRWSGKNSDSVAAHAATRRARKLTATPPWASKAALREMYTASAHISDISGISHHVDHIYPLVNARFSWLHVPWNLQILTASENSRKGNRLCP